jgi:hypothetical protein
LVTPKQIFNLQEDIVNIFDKTAAARYFTDPGDITGREGEEQPSPEEQQAQVDMQIKMKEVQIKEAELQLKAQALQFQQKELEFEMRKHEDENEFKLAELNLEASSDRPIKIGND